MSMKVNLLLALLLLLLMASTLAFSLSEEAQEIINFPRTQTSYHDENFSNYTQIIKHRIAIEPFNVIATLIFFLAIIHTMLISVFQNLAHTLDKKYEQLKQAGLKDKNSQSIPAGLLHLLGEVEAVFGIWAIALAIAVAGFYDWHTFVNYVNGLHYTEPLFIIVIMTIASSRPILKLFEVLMWRIVRLFGGTLEAWWLTLLILAPLLGSFITEPAAMTITAFLLADKFYSLSPSSKLKYVTLALLFVNISIGGALTNFAAPPILMVASKWEWDIGFMLIHFGWKSVLAISLSTFVYYVMMRQELYDLKSAYDYYNYKRHVQHLFISQSELEQNFDELELLVDKKVSFTSELKAYGFILKENIKELAKEKLTPEEYRRYDIANALDEKFETIQLEEMRRTIPGLLPPDKRPAYHDPNWDYREGRVPLWMMLVHIAFLIWTVVNSHEPVMFLSGFLFYLGFYQVTGFYQNRLDLKPALLVAFFLAGLMIHGTLQGWWIAPLLGSLPEFGLNITSIVLTAFNDNAAITYLSTLVPNLPDNLKYAVVSGALTGGGLTLIANAPNPVGQSILKRYFDPGISSVLLLKYALLPTTITALVFFILK
jgi:hypothetical protein